MPATFLELCGNYLRSLGAKLCLAECEPPAGDCCGPDATWQHWPSYPDITPPQFNPAARGPFTSPHIYCVTAAAGRWNHNAVTITNVPGGGTITTAQTIDSRIDLNGENSGVSDSLLRICRADWLVPVREVWDERNTRTDTTDPSTNFDRRDIFPSERCAGMRMWPWPTSEQASHDPRVLPDPLATVFSGGGAQPGNWFGHSPPSQTYTEEWIDRNGRHIDRTQVRFEWSATLTTATARMTATRYQWTGFPAEAPAQFDTTNDSWEAEITFGLRWLINCDGTPGPSGGCPIVQAECNPGTIRWIAGIECGLSGMGPTPFLLPAEAVQSCGVIRAPNGKCYQFRPDGPSTTDPPPGAVVGSEYVGPGSPKTCCDCGSACDKRDLATGIPLEWAWTYFRRGDDVLDRAPAFVSGNCCCYQNDRFTLLRQWTEREFYSNGEKYRVERFDIQDGPGPATFVAGFRRDVGLVVYDLRLLVTDGQGNPIEGSPFEHWQHVETNGPIGCVWLDLSSGTLVENYTLLNPLNAEGMGVRGAQLQAFPWIQEFDGQWFVERYTPLVNCQTLSVDAEWTRREGNVRSGRIVDRLTASAVWKLEQVPLPGDPCSGGCSGTPPVAGTTPPPIAGAIDIRDILGGV